ncbi:MAG: SpoIIE family protein phosphatase [Leptospiraceae bacterium]|nr:SpoIIE family protein phosphatase [Leptospiraceae bacterium]
MSEDSEKSILAAHDMGQLLYQSIFRNASVGILLLNQDRRVVFVNELAESLTGGSEKALCGSQFFDALYDERHAMRYLQKLQLAQTDPLDLDIQIKKPSGEWVDLHVTSSSFRAGEQNYILLILQNITERKASEQVMEDSFDKFMQMTIDLDAALKENRRQASILSEYKGKMDRELELAQRVLTAIIPDRFPTNEFIESAGICLPCNELGGDYLDMFELDSHRFGILVADVSGHGVASALITTMLKVYFGRHVREFSDPAEMMAAMNAETYKIFGGTGFYFTACYSVLDLQRYEIATVLGGHWAPLRYSSRNQDVIALDAIPGTLLGAMAPERTRYETAVTSLDPDDLLLFFTDGIHEARAGLEDLTLYGESRLFHFLKSNHQMEPPALVRALIRDVDRYLEGNPPNDDRSALAVRLKAKSESTGI